VFVEATRLVGATTDRIRFEMVGAIPDSPERPWAEEVLGRAVAAGIAHVARADIFAKLREWDIFVLASRRDPFPLAALEAMASARPVIGSRVDGLAEQITEEVGLLVPPDDPRALAQAILDLAADAERRRRLGEAGRERARLFTPERQADSLEEAYLAVVGRRRGGSAEP